MYGEYKNDSESTQASFDFLDKFVKNVLKLNKLFELKLVLGRNIQNGDFFQSVILWRCCQRLFMQLRDFPLPNNKQRKQRSIIINYLFKMSLVIHYQDKTSIVCSISTKNWAFSRFFRSRPKENSCFATFLQSTK
jgi:hypothetical protein